MTGKKEQSSIAAFFASQQTANKRKECDDQEDDFQHSENESTPLSGTVYQSQKRARSQEIEHEEGEVADEFDDLISRDAQLPEAPSSTSRGGGPHQQRTRGQG